MAIRKYIKFVNPTTLSVKGIRIPPTTSAYSRTLCSCGYYTDKQIYKCPQCGNEDFTVLTGWKTELHKDELQFHATRNKVEITEETYYAQLMRDVEISSMKNVIFQYDEAKREMSVPYRNAQKIIELLKANINSLPPHLKKTMEFLSIVDLDNDLNSIKTATIQDYSNLVAFVSAESEAHPRFVKELGRAVLHCGYWGHYPDIDFTSMDNYIRTYRIPPEFVEFIDSFPGAMIERTFTVRANPWRKNPTATFTVPEHWELVPPEIVSVMKYHMENGAININTFFSLGRIDTKLLKRPNILNGYLKKYLMQYTDRIIDKVNNDYGYLIDNSIPVTEQTFDAKWINQHRNVQTLKENLARTEFDIDQMVNNLDTDALSAITVLSQTKRTKKAKSAI